MNAPIQTKYSADELIDRYIQIRDAKAVVAEQHAEQMKPYNTGLETIEAALADMLNQTGGDSIKTQHGTAYRSTATTCKVEDWPGFITFVLETGDTELLVRNVNKTRFTELQESQVQVPGVTTSTIQRVNVRRS